jgi:hypothetical protein
VALQVLFGMCEHRHAAVKIVHLSIPRVLDFCMWLVWKSWTANGAVARIPLFGHTGPQSQLGTKNRRFINLNKICGLAR